jgi:hypothetical protein
MTTPRRLAIVAAGAAILLGCTRTGSSRLQGRWRGVRAEGVVGDASTAANTFAFHTKLHFEGGEMTVLSPHQAQAGHYRVVREDATSLVLVTDADGPSAPETFTFGADGTMRWAILPGKAIVFARE